MCELDCQTLFRNLFYLFFIVAFFRQCMFGLSREQINNIDRIPIIEDELMEIKRDIRILTDAVQNKNKMVSYSKTTD